MSYGVTGISDLSNNKYAAVMKEAANGLSGWSGLLLLPFLIYQIIANEFASLFSVKAILLIIVGETVFSIGARVANMLLAAITTPLMVLFGMKSKIKIAQNIGHTVMFAFGVFLCIAAWFFARYAVNYVYSSEPEQEMTEQQRNIKSCDNEARKNAEFSIHDNEAALKHKDGVYFRHFLDCARKKGYDLTEKDAQVIKLVYDPKN